MEVYLILKRGRLYELKKQGEEKRTQGIFILQANSVNEQESLLVDTLFNPNREIMNTRFSIHILSLSRVPNGAKGRDVSPLACSKHISTAFRVASDNNHFNIPLNGSIHTHLSHIGTTRNCCVMHYHLLF